MKRIFTLIFLFASICQSQTVIDSYDVSNYDADFPIYSSGGVRDLGQSITGTGIALDSVRFYVKKVGAPTGTVKAYLANHSGTFGTSSIAASTIINSNSINVTTLSGSYTLVSFVFPSPPTLTNGTHYSLYLDFFGGNSSNYLDIGRDVSSPAHGGNLFYYYTTWTAIADNDLIFYAYGPTASLPTGGVIMIMDE